MPHRLGVAGILCILLLSGCAVINNTKDENSQKQKSASSKSRTPLSSDWILPEHVEKWLSDQEYGLVLDWLDTIPHNYPGFEAVKQIHAGVKQKAEQYEKSIIRQVEKEQKKRNMDAVFLVLSSALRKLPNSKLLQNKRKKLFSKQIRQISYLNRELLIARGQYILKESRLREQLSQIDWDNPSAKWNLKRMRAELKNTSIELLRCGKKAMREGFLKQSRWCIDLAGRMFKSKKQVKLAQQINSRLANKKKQADNKDFKKFEQSGKVSAAELQELANKALSQGRLRVALDIIEDLANIEKNNKQVLQLKKALELKLSARVAALMKRGNKFYKNGSIDDAKRDWEEVLRLEPNNKEAQNNVERAQRVLEKLLELQTEEES